MKIEWQVEIDDYCQRVLAKHWPEVKRYGDVRECGAHNLEPVDLICGGFPCQPHSVAGKRRGKEDDRDLWPEYRRVLEEMRPRWMLGENVLGIITTMLDEVLSDLEDLGYTVAPLVIPAIAFDAPHRRDRIFIIANTMRERCKRWQDKQGQESSKRGRIEDCGAYMADAERTGLPKCQTSRIGDSLQSTQRSSIQDNGSNFWLPEPDVGRMADGVPARVDRLRALGNAVVPQVAQWIGHRIMQMEAGQL